MGNPQLISGSGSRFKEILGDQESFDATHKRFISFSFSVLVVSRVRKQEQ